MEYTETERRILDMWPKFEDGEYVWIGDDVSGMDVRSFVFTESGAMVTNLTSVPAYGEYRKYGEPFKRPAPKVLDADGVENKVGDTVWHAYGSEWLVEELNRYGVRCFDGAKRRTFSPTFLTHTSPDSRERVVGLLDKGVVARIDKLVKEGRWLND